MPSDFENYLNVRLNALEMTVCVFLKGIIEKYPVDGTSMESFYEDFKGVMDSHVQTFLEGLETYQPGAAARVSDLIDRAQQAYDQKQRPEHEK